MKRILALILSILVLAFSAIPCADGDSFAKTDAGQYDLTQSQPSDEDHEDACSPFCICTCCAAFSVAYTFPALSVYVINYKLNHASFYEAGTQSISLPVWQPPQLI